MKKNKKTIIFTIIAVLLIIVVPISIYIIGFKDNNQLNIKEKEWLDNNKTNIINVNVANNLNVFESNGDIVSTMEVHDEGGLISTRTVERVVFNQDGSIENRVTSENIDQ